MSGSDASAAIRVREAGMEDCAAVGRLAERFGMRARSPDTWKHVWGRNPVLAGRGEVPIGWVLERDGEIGGYLGNISRSYTLDDRELLVACPSAFAVAPAFRSRTLLLLARFFRQPHAQLWLVTTANALSGPLFSAFKTEPVPQPGLDSILFWVLDGERFVRAGLRKLEYGDPVASAAGSLLGKVAALESLARGRRPPRPRIPLPVRSIAPREIDGSFDDLWRRKHAECPTRLLATRTADMLQWQLDCSNPTERIQLLCCQRAGRMTGYAVLAQSKDTRFDLVRARIADVFVERDDPESIDHLLWHCYHHARSIGGDVLELTGLPTCVRERALRGKPWRRASSSWQVWFRATEAALQIRLADAASWYVTQIDGESMF